MSESPSAAEAARRFVRAFERADRPALDALLSSEPGLLVIGSHGQWMTDRELVLDAFVDESSGTRPTIAGGDIAAWERGDVAWAADNLTWVDPDGSSIEYRWTVVLERSEGSWRVVQSHLSAPEPS